ncbi:hypothetical protein FA95DRAFT_1576775 [Auriscalpium vulgare]|uniref:Uncharacterized protein n=1 Tax=Auriscalpium vulgare TaxID=40419 RepID=A0ACB8RB54_9AGAM|nr:hypothetical protein FA95DRAFT_1576775 [Auriscalpium vulgare]
MASSISSDPHETLLGMIRRISLGAAAIYSYVDKDDASLKAHHLKLVHEIEEAVIFYNTNDVIKILPEELRVAAAAAAAADSTGGVLERVLELVEILRVTEDLEVEGNLGEDQWWCKIAPAGARTDFPAASQSPVSDGHSTDGHGGRRHFSPLAVRLIKLSLTAPIPHDVPTVETRTSRQQTPSDTRRDPSTDQGGLPNNGLPPTCSSESADDVELSLNDLLTDRGLYELLTHRALSESSALSEAKSLADDDASTLDLRGVAEQAVADAAISRVQSLTPGTQDSASTPSSSPTSNAPARSSARLASKQHHPSPTARKTPVLPGSKKVLHPLAQSPCERCHGTGLQCRMSSNAACTNCQAKKQNCSFSEGRGTGRRNPKRKASPEPVETNSHVGTSSNQPPPRKYRKPRADAVKRARTGDPGTSSAVPDPRSKSNKKAYVERFLTGLAAVYAQLDKVKADAEAEAASLSGRENIFESVLLHVLIFARGTSFDLKRNGGLTGERDEILSRVELIGPRLRRGACPQSAAIKQQ